MIIIFLVCGVFGLSVAGSMVNKGFEMRDELDRIEDSKKVSGRKKALRD